MVKVSKTVGKPDFITSDNAVVGYGAIDLHVELIPCWLARLIIKEFHYSKRFVNNSYFHVGIYNKRELVGVMQWGYALNPNSGANVVFDTKNRDYMELNRLWIHDKMPKNTASRALSYSFKLMRQLHPTVQWVQSFADERCGKNGVVYQASNFDYVGSHVTKFYELDGDYYHPICLTAKKRGGKRGEYLRANIDRATTHKLRQFRYIKFFNKRARKRLNTNRFKLQPYPK